MNTNNEAIQLLIELNKKMDRIDTKLNQIEKEANKKAVVSGAVAGGLCGGIVATCIVAIKAKMGL